MIIIDPKDVFSMSTVIGICGTNFCSLIADTRKTEYITRSDGSTYSKPENDDTSKILKVNDRVLFGIAGMFFRWDEVTAPIDSFVDKSVISVRYLYKATIEHLKQNWRALSLTRNYLIAGKDHSGRFLIYEIHYDGYNRKLETMLRSPEPPTSNFGISCCFPRGVLDRKDEFSQKVSDCVRSSSRHDEMLEKVAAVIREIADIDDTVGKKVETLSVF